MEQSSTVTLGAMNAPGMDSTPGQKGPNVSCNDKQESGVPAVKRGNDGKTESFRVLTSDGHDVTHLYRRIHNYLVSSELDDLVQRAEALASSSRRFVRPQRPVTPEPAPKPARTPVNHAILHRLFERRAKTDARFAWLAAYHLRMLKREEAAGKKDVCRTVHVDGIVMEMPV